MADFARGQRFRELREQRHLSQEALAHEVGVSVKTIRAWEKGSGIKWPNAEEVGKFYGVDPGDLVRHESDGQPSVDGQPSQLDRIERKLDYLIGALAPEIAAAAVEPQATEASPPGSSGKRPSKSKSRVAPKPTG